MQAQKKDTHAQLHTHKKYTHLHAAMHTIDTHTHMHVCNKHT